MDFGALGVFKEIELYKKREEKKLGESVSFTELVILSSKTYLSLHSYALGVDVKKNVIVTITSDKGLCGGINSTSVKISRGLRKLNSGTL